MLPSRIHTQTGNVSDGISVSTVKTVNNTAAFYQAKTDLPSAKLSEVNSSRDLFYLGEKILKGHTSLGLPEWGKIA